MMTMREKKRFRQKRFQPRCKYCGETFTPRRKNQEYCTPERERKLYFERKWALVGALATQFRRWGWKARDMLAVARRCIEVAYEHIYSAMMRLGWRYHSQDKVWRFSRQAF